jgi:murein DD-endopeptidase MepM/ murein hydrolase activator NlpD
MQNNKLFVKLKEDKGAMAIALTVGVMLLVLTVIIVTTVIANRNAQEDVLPPVDSEQVGVSDPDDLPTDTEGDQAPEVEEPAPDTETNVLPERFLLPVSGVLQSNHDATVQVFSPTMGDYRTHLGIDIGTVAGAVVCAMADGVIAQVWEDVSMGQCVAVKHGGDAYTIYKNLSVELPEGVVVGRSVKAGEVIGTVGESAMIEVAQEPHLHLEMTVGGLAVDPTDYLDQDAMATLREDTNFEDVS